MTIPSYSGIMSCWAAPCAAPVPVPAFVPVPTVGSPTPADPLVVPGGVPPADHLVVPGGNPPSVLSVESRGRNGRALGRLTRMTYAAIRLSSLSPMKGSAANGLY